MKEKSTESNKETLIVEWVKIKEVVVREEDVESKAERTKEKVVL